MAQIMLVLRKTFKTLKVFAGHSIDENVAF